MAMSPDDKLTGIKLLGFCQQMIPLLRHLRDTDTTMSYRELAARIRLIKADGWRPWHRSQISKILYACSALDKYADVQEFDNFADYGRIVVGGSGEPGQGLRKIARIVITDPGETTELPGSEGA